MGYYLHNKYHISKKLGRLAAYLITTILSQNHYIFNFNQAKKNTRGTSTSFKSNFTAYQKWHCNPTESRTIPNRTLRAWV